MNLDTVVNLLNIIVGTCCVAVGGYVHILPTVIIGCFAISIGVVGLLRM